MLTTMQTVVATVGGCEMTALESDEPGVEGSGSATGGATGGSGSTTESSASGGTGGGSWAGGGGAFGGGAIGGTSWTTQTSGRGGSGGSVGTTSGGLVAEPCVGQPVSFETSTVSFRAESFWILANDECYTTRGAAVQVHSDPGDSRYTSLELVWTELEREMRLFIYFSADASGWWSNEMRTYDGSRPYGEWLYYYGDYFGTPIGQVFQGDLSLTNDAKDSIRGQLHVHGLILSTTLTGR